MENKKKWHLTIINNETGKVERDLASGIIIGACDVDEETTACFSFVAGRRTDVFATLETAEEAIKKTYSKHPELLLMKKLSELGDTDSETAEPVETTENK